MQIAVIDLTVNQQGRVTWAELRPSGKGQELFLMIAEWGVAGVEMLERSSWECRWFAAELTPERIRIFESALSAATKILLPL